MTQPATPCSPRLDALRAALKAQGLGAWIAFTSDPHLSEYLPPHWQTRAWLSGFTGSAGTLLVTREEALLWVDSRYWVDAEAQVQGSGIRVVRAAAASGGELMEWIAQHLRGERVGVDGACLGLGLGRSLEAAVQRAGGSLHTGLDLPGTLWSDRPALPAAPLSARRAGLESLTRAGKIAAVRAQMAQAGAAWHWISSLDDIAWLLDLRGSDVAYQPVFLAHVLVGPREVQLFVGAGRVPAEIGAALARDGVVVHPYGAAGAAPRGLPADAVVLIDPRRVTRAIVEALPPGARIVEQVNPSTLLKSRKGEVELRHVRLAMERDGAALCAFFAWLETALTDGSIVTELTIDERVCAERARQPGYVSPSFGTIAGFNANGAAPHYSATPAAHATVRAPGVAEDGLLLIDSGGQYEEGTTDITRVVAIGSTSLEQRRDFTRVLRGMIALSRARFPRGTRSPLLDPIARAPIWEAGIDYGHGTGHGVGYFLSVHEGPQSISPHAAPEASTAMEAGMITSNEPGIYRPGKWGVRIENLLAAVPAATDGEFGEFLEFETLTLCPIDRRCIERGLLRADEIAWLDAYHVTVRSRLAPYLDGAARDWLLRATEAL